MVAWARFKERFGRGHRPPVWLIVVVVVALVLLGARLVLPGVALRVANARLAEAEQVAGRIGALDLRVVAGGFALEGLELQRGGQDDPAGELRITVDRIDVSFSWIQLMGGRLRAEVEIERPVVYVARGATQEEPAEERRDPREVLAEQRRFEVVRLEVREGAATVAWPVGERTQRLELAALQVMVENFGNDPARGEEAVTKATLRGRFAGGGEVLAEAEGAPMASEITVDARLEVDELDLTLFNATIIEKMGTDLTEGTLRLEAEFHAAAGRYEGYVKPFVTDARFTQARSEDESFAAGVRAVILDVVAGLLSNPETERVATEVPFSGDFGDPEVDGWAAFWALLGNAFGEALRAGRVVGD